MNETVIEGTYTDRTSVIENKFKDTYGGIARANALLRNIDGVDMPEEQKAIYKGEAKFMRALYYFHLLDFYGGVPLYDETTVAEEEYMEMKKPRSTVEETRKFILDDLQEAINVLPVHWEQTEYGRATRGAAVALRGKVKLYAKDYPGAAADFEEIVNDPDGRGYNYGLYHSYAKLFTPEGDSSNEMILLFRIWEGQEQNMEWLLAFVWEAVLPMEVDGITVFLPIYWRICMRTMTGPLLVGKIGFQDLLLHRQFRRKPFWLL